MHRVIRAVITITALFIATVLLPQKGIAVDRQPEEQNLLVTFGETPETPDYPDIGISVHVWPTQIEPGKSVFLSGAYSADGELLTHCKQNLAACVILTLIRVVPDLTTKSLPLILQTYKTQAPPAGEYGPDYREGEQFQLDLVSFFNIPALPAEYTIEASIGAYTSGTHTFQITPVNTENEDIENL